MSDDSDDEEQVPVPVETRDTAKGKGKAVAPTIYKTKLAPLLSVRQHAVVNAKAPAPVRCLSGMTVADDFEVAHCILKIRWEECNDSHRGKLADE